MAPLRPSCRYNLDPTIPRPSKLDLEDNIRQRKAHSKRDMAKFAKESEYAQDPALKEVLPHSKCRRCLANHWRCFISSDPKSPRKVCKPCGKNKCSFGYSTIRPMTFEDDGADALPDDRTTAHAAHAGLIGRHHLYMAPYYGAGAFGGAYGATMGALGGMAVGADREDSASSTSSAGRPALSIATRDLTPRHLPLPALKSSFNAYQPPHSRPALRRVDTEPLSHSLSSAGHALSGHALTPLHTTLSAHSAKSEPHAAKGELAKADGRPHSASSAYSAPVYYNGYYCNGYYYPYTQEYYYPYSYEGRRSERGAEDQIPTPAPTASPGAKVEP